MIGHNSTKHLNNTIPGFQYFDEISENNRTPITSGPYFDRAEASLFGILIYPFCIILVYVFLGLIGNSVVLYIFSLKWRRTKTSVFIITLAILDIINCSVNMPIEVAVLSKPMSFDYDIFCKFARCLSYITTASYSFLLVAVAFDRYLMVCRPLKRMTLGKRYATRTCIGAVLIGILTQWPSIFIYGTFIYKVPIPQSNTTVGNISNIIYVQGKTCLVTNYYYYENPTLTYAFQGFLFVGHVIIFSTLTVVYIIIGKRLYISSHMDFEDTESKTNLFKEGLISALTGSVLCGKRRTTSMSSEPMTNRRPRISTVSELSIPEHRLSAASDVSDNGLITGDQRTSADKFDKSRKNYGTNASRSMHNIYSNSACKYSPGHNQIDLRVFNETKENKPGPHQNNTTPFRMKRLSSEADSPNRASTASGDSTFARPLLPRSVSLDAGQILSTCIEKPKKLDLKELSLKRNTLIMRMVTFTFMLSYLPFLVIVTLRYSNPDIPGKLSRVPLTVYHIFLRSYFFNSVTRPFIYAFMNKEYRKCVVQLFTCRE